MIVAFSEILIIILISTLLLLLYFPSPTLPGDAPFPISPSDHLYPAIPFYAPPHLLPYKHASHSLGSPTFSCSLIRSLVTHYPLSIAPQVPSPGNVPILLSWLLVPTSCVLRSENLELGAFSKEEKAKIFPSGS